MLLVLLVACGAGQSLRGWCEGRILCSDEAADSRVCVLVEASLDLQEAPESEAYLTNSHPASGVLAVDRCDDKPDSPLLSNAFGVMAPSKVYGELDVVVKEAAICGNEGAKCSSLPDLPAKLRCVLEHSPTVYVMLNRDMTGNIFHILCNTMYPLFRVRERLGLDFASNRTRLVLVDQMPVSGVEMELLGAILGENRIDAMAPSAMQCFGALVVGGKDLCGALCCTVSRPPAANRHWRTWLHGKSRFGELIPFAQWLKNAFQIGEADSDESGRPLVTVVDRKGTRAVLNMDELVAALQEAMPTAKIHRQAFELLSFHEQLKVER